MDHAREHGQLTKMKYVKLLFNQLRKSKKKNNQAGQIVFKRFLHAVKYTEFWVDQNFRDWV